MSKTPKGAAIITVRIEPNYGGETLVWNIQASDGTRASGFARTHADAMRDAAAFVEAMAQPRLGGLRSKPVLRPIDGGAVRETGEGTL